MGPIVTWTGSVRPEWIDYNDHMSEGHYGLVFSEASDQYLLGIGFDADYRRHIGGAFYTVETHTSFLNEIDPAGVLEVRTIVAGVDALRLHLYHELWDGETAAATQESLMMHVSTATGRVAPMHRAVMTAAAGHAGAHTGLVDRDRLGKAIRGPRP